MLPTTFPLIVTCFAWISAWMLPWRSTTKWRSSSSIFLSTHPSAVRSSSALICPLMKGERLGRCIQFLEPQLEQMRLPKAETVRSRLPSQSTQNMVRFSRVRLTLRFGLSPRFSQVLLLRKLRIFALLNVCSMAINVPCLFSIQTVNAFIFPIAATSKRRPPGQTRPARLWSWKIPWAKEKGDGRLWECNVRATLGCFGRGWWKTCILFKLLDWGLMRILHADLSWLKGKLTEGFFYFMESN